MGLPKRLTEKQIKFANLVVSEEGRKTNTECAVEAGYEENSAYVSASKLQNPLLYPLVTQYIGRLRAEKIKKYDITYEKHLAELGKIRDEARENKAWSAAGNMEIARGKAGGFQNNTNLHLHKNLDNADESELDKMLEQALKNYKPIFDSTAEVKSLKPKTKRLKSNLFYRLYDCCWNYTSITNRFKCRLIFI
jgi:phage terminase small subunit